MIVDFHVDGLDAELHHLPLQRPSVDVEEPRRLGDATAGDSEDEEDVLADGDVERETVLPCNHHSVSA